MRKTASVIAAATVAAAVGSTLSAGTAAAAPARNVDGELLVLGDNGVLSRYEAKPNRPFRSRRWCGSTGSPGANA